MTGHDAYDTIGLRYAESRRTEPRFAALIDEALGGAVTVIDVGAGTGSYEPRGRRVVAVEPSAVMIGQRPPAAASVVRAVAEALPLRGRFDAALAVLTVHHWTDASAGLQEMARVSRRQVILTWDREVFHRFWLVSEYLPEIAAREKRLTTLPEISAVMRVRETVTVPVPAQCCDGFCGAYWRRPEKYLDEAIRSSMSAFARCDATSVKAAMSRLENDLASGRWRRDHAALLEVEEADLGYRLLVCEGTRVGWSPSNPAPRPAS